MAAPGDDVLVCYPSGDANCDGLANSQDALLILQIVAELTTSIGLPCIGEANVFSDAFVNSIDALSILQSEAGLIGALPVPQ